MNLETLVLEKIKLSGKLLPLQFSVWRKLKNNNFAFVLDEVGCGKTIEAGISIWNVVKGGGKNVLIVAPSNLTFNWYTEMLSKFGLDFKIIGGTKDAVDLYKVNNRCPHNKVNCKSLSNLCIVSYDSRNSDTSNSALDRIMDYVEKWDLIVLDEGHESKSDSTNRYKTLSKFSSEKVLFLSATPIKNLRNDFDNESSLVKSILKSEISLELDPVKAISFDLDYPVSRNFKEIVAGKAEFKSRAIEQINYEVSDEIVENIACDGLELDRKRGCVFLFDKALRKSCSAEYAVYRKSRYEGGDIAALVGFDKKLNALITKIEMLKPEERCVIFCNHREVVDYLKKVLCAKFGADTVEALHGDSHSQEERKNRIFLLDKNDDEMKEKRIVILSHNIGGIGINMSKFSHLFNYELPYTPADLEQRFGRIDRITNENEKLTMYFFKDQNNCFDTVYLNRILIKLQYEVLPLLPSKNILNSTKAFEESYIQLVKALAVIKEYLGKTHHNDKEINSAIEHYFEKKPKENDGTLGFSENDVEDIIAKIRSIFDRLGIMDDEDSEALIRKIHDYCANSSNTISFMNGNKTEKLRFDDILKVVNTESFNQFKETIEALDSEINSAIKTLCDKYELCDEDKSSQFIAYLQNEINLNKLDENMIFPALYGCWNALQKCKMPPKFIEFIQAYNNRRGDE